MISASGLKAVIKTKAIGNKKSIVPIIIKSQGRIFSNLSFIFKSGIRCSVFGVRCSVFFYGHYGHYGHNGHNGHNGHRPLITPLLHYSITPLFHYSKIFRSLRARAVNAAIAALFLHSISIIPLLALGTQHTPACAGHGAGQERGLLLS